MSLKDLVRTENQLSDQRSLGFAVDKGKVEIVEHYLHIGTDTNIEVNHRTPLLFRAISLKHDRIAELVINYHLTNIFVTDRYDDNALNMAVCYNKINLVKLLLSKGFDINQKGQGGDTPLHSAVAYNYYEMTKLLLDHGANIDLINDDKQTPYQVAIGGGRKLIIKLIENHQDTLDIKEPDV